MYLALDSDRPFFRTHVAIAMVTKLYALLMVSTLIRDPLALSTNLTLLSSLNPWAYRSLNHMETLDLASNYYRKLKCHQLLEVIFFCFNVCTKVGIAVFLRHHNYS